MHTVANLLRVLSSKDRRGLLMGAPPPAPAHHPPPWPRTSAPLAARCAAHSARVALTVSGSSFRLLPAGDEPQSRGPWLTLSEAHTPLRLRPPACPLATHLQRWRVWTRCRCSRS